LGIGQAGSRYKINGSAGKIKGVKTSFHRGDCDREMIYLYMPGKTPSTRKNTKK
jgi:hypothetical protein